MEYTVQLPKRLYEVVRQRAAAQKMSPDALVAEWVSAQVEEPEIEARKERFEKEIAAFERLKPDLLKQYPEQYVAIHQGKVVVVGENRLDVVEQVYRQFGLVVCYVEKVTTDPPRRVRMPSFWKVK